MTDSISTKLDDAVRHFHEGRLEQVVALLEDVCRSGQANSATWFLYGASLHRLGELTPALNAFNWIIQNWPDDAQAHSAQAAVLLDLKRPEEAIKSCNRALALAPDNAPEIYNASLVLEELGHLEAAAAGYRRALSRQPNFFAASLNLFALLARQGELEAANECAEYAIRQHPDVAECWFNLGDIRFARYRPHEALTAFSQALFLEPAMEKAAIGKGLALSALGFFPEAMTAFSHAIKLNPAVFEEYRSPLITDYIDTSFVLDPRRIFCNTQFQRLTHADWTERNNFVEVLRHLISSSAGFATPLLDRSLPHAAFALPLCPAERFDLARQVAAGVAEQAERINQGAPAHRRIRRDSDALRLGYVSPDFREHATAYLVRQMFSRHDRNRFKVFGYALTPYDGSRIACDIAAGCDEYAEVHGMSSMELVRKIRSDGIDILVDLAGYSSYARPEIFAARCAPLQAGYLVYPGSLGGAALDYALVDPTVCPSGSEVFWSESLLRLPGTYALFDDQVEVELTPGRHEAGLPHNAFVFCCMNSAWKITPEIFELWMRLLKRLSSAVLWLYGDDAQLHANLRMQAEHYGISPDRIIFADHVAHESHLARYPLADLFLDTLPCNAHTTAAEALWMGVPVLTCIGNEMHGRVAASLLQAAGLPELIATNLGDYEDMAYRLASEPGVLSAQRRRLGERRQAGKLFNTRDKVRDLERAYDMMWQRHLAGLLPVGFEVPTTA